MSDTKRVQYIDIARGIAILCIILGHQGISDVNRVVFTFHVPIFFFITGYFINDKLGIKDFIKNRVRTLLVPYALMCVLMIVLATFLAWYREKDVLVTIQEWVFASLYGAGDTYYEPFYIKKIEGLWFLWAMFWGSIFMRISMRMKPMVRMIFILGLFGIGYWTAHYIFWFPLSIQAGCCATLFIYVGYLAKQAKPIYQELSSEVKAGGVILSLLLWGNFVQNFESFWLVHCDMGRGIIDFVGSICGCYLLILLSKGIEKHCKHLTRLFAHLGRYSLLVLCVHILELKVIPWKLVRESLMAGWGIEELQVRYMLAIVRIVLVVILSFICSKINIVAWLFGLRKSSSK